MKARVLSVLRLFVPQKNELIALLLGAASVLAFAPFEFAFVMLLGLAGLFWLWQQKAQSVYEGFKIGLWFGLGLFGAGVSWLFSSMYFYSNVNIVLSIVATFLFVLFLSFYIGLAGWLVLYFKDDKRPGLMLFVLFPAVWVAAEYLRGNLFGGFPFLQIGLSHIDSWLAGYAPLLGVLGVSWAVAISAGLLLWFAQQRAWFVPGLMLGVLWATGGLLQKVQWVEPSGKPIDIALVQGNIPQEKKWRRDEFYPSLKRYVEMTKQHIDADVIVWPETAIATYFDVVEKGALYSFIKDAKLMNKDILVGVIAGKDKTYYNALVNLGKPQERYYKTHLVPFSEYFPFVGFFKFLNQFFDIPYDSFAHGPENQPPLKLGGQLAGLSVCYEMAFGEELARYLPEAKYLITVSNDAWFAHTLEPAQQLQEVRMRALELGREIARSTNTGHTVVVGVDGQIKAQIPAYEEGVLRDKVQPYDGMTFFAQWKQLPIEMMLFAIFGFVLGKRYFLTGRFGKTKNA